MIGQSGRSSPLQCSARCLKRALWIVVLLNVGYGIIEIGGSFLAGSQALQADSLDFIGDGLISMAARPRFTK